MTPGQQGDARLLLSDLNSIYLRADTLARKLSATSSHQSAQVMRDILGQLASAESSIASLLDDQRARERREAAGT